MKMKKNIFWMFILIFSFLFFGVIPTKAEINERINTEARKAVVQSLEPNVALEKDNLLGEEDSGSITNEEEILNDGQEEQNASSSQKLKGKGLKNAIQRRSQVANAVQEMLKVAERDGGIGEQVRVIAQNQEKNQEKVEAKLEKIQNRNKLVRFIFGPDNQEIKNARKLLQDNRDELTRLENVRSQLVDVVDQQKVQEQIEKIQEASIEIENDLNRSEKVFSLFGWMKNIFSK